MDRYRIGDILVEMDLGQIPVLHQGNLGKFSHSGNWHGETVALQCTTEDLQPYTQCVIKPDDIVCGIYEHRGEKLLLYHWGNRFHGFAVWPDRFQVSFSPEMINQPPLREDWFFSVCAFHRQLLLREACVFHSSYLDIGGQAILFTGPSGMGKSTQAELWCTHAGASVINGDRTLLRKRGDIWHAFGYPCCGTSGISINRTLPLRAIVVLEQARENRVEQIPAGEKIRLLAAAMEIYPWEPAEIHMALDIAQKLAAQIPVVKLCCRPDAGAVETLKTYLEETACDNPF